LGGQFIAGILQYLPALCALTTPSVASYYRLRPNRWAPVRADVGLLDRGAAVRICPVSGNERAERARRELAEHRPGPLPTSLGEALTLLEECKRAGEWLGGELLPAYVRFKRAEIQGLDRLEESEIIRRYAEVY
jgi:glutamine synthetase